MEEKEKKRIRLISLIIAIIAWYSATMPIWIKYYPSLKKLPFAEHFMHPYGSLWKYISPPIKKIEHNKKIKNQGGISKHKKRISL